MASGLVLLGFFSANRKQHFFSGPCLMETTKKRGSTQLEVIDVGKGNIFCQTDTFWGEKIEEIE